MDVLEKAYRAKQVRELFDLKLSTFYALIERGAFPPADYHLGKMPMWTHSTLERHRQALIAAQAKPRRKQGAKNAEHAAP